MCHLLSNKKFWSSRKSLDLGLGLERQGLGLEQQGLGLGLGLDKKVLVTALVISSNKFFKAILQTTGTRIR